MASAYLFGFKLKPGASWVKFPVRFKGDEMSGLCEEEVMYLSHLLQLMLRAGPGSHIGAVTLIFWPGTVHH